MYSKDDKNLIIKTKDKPYHINVKLINNMISYRMTNCSKNSRLSRHFKIFSL